MYTELAKMAYLAAATLKKNWSFSIKLNMRSSNTF